MYAALRTFPQLAFELNFLICICWMPRTAFHQRKNICEKKLERIIPEEQGELQDNAVVMN
jgi:hypothetical protein